MAVVSVLAFSVVKVLETGGAGEAVLDADAEAAGDAAATGGGGC